MTGLPDQELAHKLEILTRLAETSVVLNSTLALKPLLNVLMERAAEIVGAEGTSVLLWDDRHHELRFAASMGGGGEALLDQPVPLEGSLAGAILREDRALLIEDAQSDPRHYRQTDEATAFRTRSLLGVPMRSKQRVIGVLEAVNKRQPPWTDDDARYLEILAAQAAVAIEGAQLVNALRKANDELARLDEIRSSFIAIASHELRTPLGIILGYSTLLQSRNAPDVRELAGMVVSSAQHMRRIVDDLTNLRFLDQRELQLERASVPLAGFVANVVAGVQPQADEAGNRIIVAPLPDLTLWIDEARLGQALHNVLNNAVRFTPPRGEIRLEAAVRGGEVWLKVRDTGIGIARENLERIFERFQQVEAHMTRQYGGMGIGLSIARGLVAAHGGRIWAESPGLNQGTTVIMALPLRSPSSEIIQD